MFIRALLRSKLVLSNTSHVPHSLRTLSTTPTRLSGHSKWSKIKHRKGAEDAKKSKVYSKAARDIVSAAKAGGSMDPEQNPLLANVVRRAKEAGVPRENIENALARAERSKTHGEPMLFEAIYGSNVGILIECRSDNVNRTVKYVKDILNTHGARSAPVKFMFQQRGYVKLIVGEDDMDPLLAKVIETGFADFEEWSEDDQRGLEIVCQPSYLSKVMNSINDFASSSPRCEVLTSEVNWAPLESQEIPEDDEGMNRLETLIEALEENDDVERVYTTLEPNNLIVETS